MKSFLCNGDPMHCFSSMNGFRPMALFNTSFATPRAVELISTCLKIEEIRFSSEKGMFITNSGFRTVKGGR